MISDEADEVSEELFNSVKNIKIVYNRWEKVSLSSIIFS